MKIKRVLSSLLICITSLHGEQTFLPSITDKPSQEVATLYSLAPVSPLSSSQTIVANFNASLARFIRERYNEPGYAKELSQNGNDVVTLLSLTANTPALGTDRIIYSYTIVRLMLEKMKSWECELIDDTVIHYILSSLPGLLGEYFNHKEFQPLEQLQQQSALKLEEWARTFVNTSLDEQRKSIHTLPELFIKECNKFREEVINIEDARAKLRGVVLRLTELMLSKITWSLSNYEGILPSFISIGYDIQRLFKSTIFDDEDDRDSAWKSLVEGFCKYLRLVGPYIPLPALNQVARAVLSKEIPFLEIEEQDDGVTPKKEIIVRCLLSIKPHVYAVQKKGMMRDTPIIS